MIPHSKPDIGAEEIGAAARVLESGMLAQGREVEAFETECAAFLGRRHAVATSSGTAALHLALIALGAGEGDAVALPAYACAALLQPVTWLRARPVLCDAGPDCNLDADGVPESARAVVAAHLFGKPGPVPYAERAVEDIAQSFGGPTGRAGRIAVASFYATKLLTTGEGGMLVTDDAGVAELARDLRDYDNRDDFRPRYACKMTEFQAAVGRVQLTRLPGFIARRREIAARYTEAFAGLPLGLPDATGHVFFRYVLRTARREALGAHLVAGGVEAKRPVYRPLHHYTGDTCDSAETAHDECLSIPIYPALTSQEAGNVIYSVQSFFGEREASY